MYTEPQNPKQPTPLFVYFYFYKDITSFVFFWVVPFLSPSEIAPDGSVK